MSRPPARLSGLSGDRARAAAAVGGRRAAAAAAAVVGAAALLAGAAPARAEEGDLPAGKIGLSVGPRSGLGALADDYGLGVVLSIDAAYQPMNVASRWGLGIQWSALWGWFGASDGVSVTGNLRTLELEASLRARIPMSDLAPRFAVIGAGAAILRATVPLPPDGERDYLGPFASLGVEQYVRGGELLVSFEVRYGLIATGPGSLSILLGGAFGR